MRLKKNAGRLAGALMAGTLMVSMLGMTVSAAGVHEPGVYGPEGEGTAVSSVPVKKTVTTDGNTYAPNTTFCFEVGVADNEVEKGEKESDKTFDGTRLPVYKGTDGGLSVSGEASYAGAETDPSESYEFTGANLTFGSFQKPGIYHYVVRETSGAYEGVIYSNEVYDVYVYALRNTEDDSIYVGYVETVKQGDASAKGELSFTNDYGKDNDTIHSVTVTKRVEGTMADMTKGFDFTVLVSGVGGEKYKVVVQNDAEKVEYQAVSGEPLDTDPGVAGVQPVVLKNTGSITIYGLSENDTYTVTEEDYSSDGYTTYVDNQPEEGREEGRIATGKAMTDVTRTIYNVKNAVTPTGIILNIAPYILMVALAGILAFFFLRRRKSGF